MKKWKRGVCILLIAMLVLPLIMPMGTGVVHAETRETEETSGVSGNDSIDSFLTKIGEGNYSYNADVNTITLQNNVEIIGGVFLEQIPDTLTLDLNGKTMTLLSESEEYARGGITVNYDADFAITNSGIITTQYRFPIIFVNGGDFRMLKSGNPASAVGDYAAGVPALEMSCIYPESVSYYSDALQISNEKLDDGTVIRANAYIEDAYISSEGGGGVSFYGGTLQIDSATISATKDAIHNNSTLSQDILTVRGGTYTSLENKALVITPSQLDGQLEAVFGQTYLSGGSYHGQTGGISCDTSNLFITGPISVDTVNNTGIAAWDSSIVVKDTQSQITGNSNGMYAENCDIYIAGGTYASNGVGIWIKNCGIDILGGTFQGPKYSGLYVDEDCDVYISGGEFSGNFGLDTWKNSGTVGPKVYVYGGNFEGKTCGIRMHDSLLDMTDATVLGENAEGAYLEDTDMYLRGGNFEGSYALKFAAFLDENETAHTKAYLLLGEDGENHLQLVSRNENNSAFWIVNQNSFDIFQISKALNGSVSWAYSGQAFEMVDAASGDGSYWITNDSNPESYLSYPDTQAVSYGVNYVNAEDTMGNERNPQYVQAGQTYPLYNIYKEGAYFVGWYTEPEFVNEVTQISCPTSDVTLYAKFAQEDRNQKQTMNISFDREISMSCVETTPFVPAVNILTGNQDSAIVYTVSNPDVAKITSDGKVQLTGKTGTTCLMGHIPGNEQYFSKDFDIFLRVDKQQAVIKYTVPSDIMPSTKDLTFQAKVTNTNGAPPGKLSYLSSNTVVLEVDENGKLIPHKSGESTIIIQMDETDNCKADVVRFNVTVKPEVVYNIQFNKNGNSLSGTFSTMKNCSYGTSYKLPTTSTKKRGYYLTWNTRADGKGTSYNAGASVKGLTKTNKATVTLYAVWKKAKYTITYNLNSGTNNSKNPAYYYVTSNTITLQNPSRKGYTFLGWYKDSKYTTRVKEITKGSAGNLTLYAKWSANRYSVKFNGNGSTSGTMANEDFVYNAGAKALTANTYKRKGYTFLEWNTKADGSGKAYANKAAVRNLTYSANGVVNLYAQWKKVKYTITYNLNSGTNNSKNPTYYYVTSNTITLQNPSRKGYTFLGWYKDSKYKTRVKEITKGSAGNVTLYAKWSANKYSVRFNGNGSTSGTMADETFVYNAAAKSLTANGFKRTGYTFIGWNTKADGSGTAYTDKASIKNLTYKANAVINLYAQWKKVKYTITYNVNGGTNNSGNPAYYYVTSSTITLKNPTRSGYKFCGWYKDSKFSSPVKEITRGSVGNRILYAKWKKL
ncbi:MAG: InlB B-repeat-containing protein [Lachnospiraceae bacterium]|nr:InlB B-repeat-containing protein [Lachnospiraceae bacterium]